MAILNNNINVNNVNVTSLPFITFNSFFTTSSHDEIKKRRSLSPSLNEYIVIVGGNAHVVDLTTKEGVAKLNSLFGRVREENSRKEVIRTRLSWKTRKTGRMLDACLTPPVAEDPWMGLPRPKHLLSSNNIVRKTVGKRYTHSQIRGFGEKLESLIKELTVKVKLHEIKRERGQVYRDIRLAQEIKGLSLQERVEVLDYLYRRRGNLKKSEDLWKKISKNPHLLSVVKVEEDDPSFYVRRNRRWVRLRKIEAIIKVSLGRGVLLRLTVLIDSKNNIKGGDLQKIGLVSQMDPK